MSTGDNLFREIASLYAERDGQALRLEMNALPAQDTGNLDRRVRRQITRMKLRPVARPALLVAACLVLALLLPRVISPATSNMSAPSAGEAATRLAAEPEMADEAAPELYDLPQVEMGGNDEPVAEDSYDGGGLMGGEPMLENPATAGGGGMEAASKADSIVLENPVTAGGIGRMSGAAEAEIPLSFSLPESYYVLWSEEDNGQSVYYLGNYAQDDVVLTMRHMDGPLASGRLDEDGFSPMELEGGEVYYKYTADYNIIAFEKDDIYYELSCKYDLATLLILGESIL